MHSCLKFDGWPWKAIGHVFYAVPRFVHHFVATSEFKLELQSGNSQFGQNRGFVVLCDHEILLMTLENNRAPVLSNIKHSSHCHIWIQAGITVPKGLSCVLTSVTLTFDLWPWPFAWISLQSLVIIPENFMMIRCWQHNEKGVTDGLIHSSSCLVAAKTVARLWPISPTGLPPLGYLLHTYLELW